MSQEIVALLSRSNRAVERGIVALLSPESPAKLSAKEVYDARYFASWINGGNNLSGSFLDRARKLCIDHAASLAIMADHKRPTCKSLTLNRSGVFTVETVPGSDHCGTQRFQEIRYQAEVKCGSKLDRRGFLIDQLNVDRFFQAQRKTNQSCERYAMTLAHGLRVALMSENPNIEIHHLKLTLSPRAPNGDYSASMTVEL